MPSVRTGDGFGAHDVLDLGSWFDEAELGACPSCGQRRLLPAAGEIEPHCLDCGFLFGERGPRAEEAAADSISRGEQARRTARELREEAEALLAQARHQARRAAKNLRRLE
jgi:hypothetical protein